MGVQQLKNVGVERRGGGHGSTSFSAGQCQNDRQQNDCTGERGQACHQYEAEKRAKDLRKLRLSLMLCHKLYENIQRQKGKDHCRKIKIYPDRQCQGHIQKHRLFSLQKLMGCQHHHRKQDNGIQPHNIPVIAGHKSGESIEKPKDNDGNIVFLKTFAQISGEGHSTQRSLQSDQKRHCLTETFPGKAQSQEIQGGGSIVGCLDQKVFSQPCGPAVKQTVSVQQFIAQLFQKRCVLMV